MTEHALPNAAIPTTTIIGFMVGTLIAGAVVVESVFAWPGIGRLLVVSVANRDLAVVQTILLFVAATMVTANIIVDFLYGWIDPRMRTGPAMTVTAASTASSSAAAARAFSKRGRRSPWAALAWIALMLVVAFGADWLAPYRLLGPRSQGASAAARRVRRQLRAMRWAPTSSAATCFRA